MFLLGTLARWCLQPGLSEQRLEHACAPLRPVSSLAPFLSSCGLMVNGRPVARVGEAINPGPQQVTLTSWNVTALFPNAAIVANYS
eukprot:1855183-Alexandrium_andersonii.AAC.1